MATTDGTPRRGPTGARAATRADPTTVPSAMRTKASVTENAGTRLAPVTSVVATMLAPTKIRKRSRGDCVRASAGTGPRSAACIRLVAGGGSRGHGGAAALLHDLHAHAGSDAVGAGVPAGTEAGRGLHEVRAPRLRHDAGLHLLVVGEERGLDDDLEDGPAAVAGLRNGGHVALAQPVVPGLEGADVEDHVHFAGALRDRARGLEGLDLGEGGAQGEAHDGADARLRSPQQRGAQRDPGGVHAHGREAVLACLRAELLDLGAGGVGLEQ